MTTRLKWVRQGDGDYHAFICDGLAREFCGLVVSPAGATSTGRPTSWNALFRGTYLTATLRGEPVTRVWPNLTAAKSEAEVYLAGVLERKVGETVDFVAHLRGRPAPRFAALVTGDDGDFLATCLRTGTESDCDDDGGTPHQALRVLEATLSDGGPDLVVRLGLQ